MGPQLSAFKIKNVRLFIWFRVFFNSRFYYPVFTILFLDFGLTLEQFALLNLVWALTIVILEIPSGAMADTIGRKNLLVFAGACMVLEMGLLCFVPLGNPSLIFYAFLANRVLSGSAEAAASGADEALAYDALKKEGNPKDWGRVLVRQMGWRSAGFVVAMSVGAAVYDPALVERTARWLGFSCPFNQSSTLRFPLYLTLINALVTLSITLSMQKIQHLDATGGAAKPGQSIFKAFKLTLDAGKWILQTPFALIIILSGMFFDHLIRMMITLNSEYYRMIQLPESAFGLIGSGLALLGLLVPRIALKMAEKHTPAVNLYILAAIALAGFWGVTLFLPVYGLIPMALLSGVMYFTGFFVSHYLNRITDSEQRATVLSFKGLSFNLAYGLVCLLYAMLLGFLRSHDTISNPQVSETLLETRIFMQSLNVFPWYFIVCLVFLVIFSARKMRRSRNES